MMNMEICTISIKGPDISFSHKLHNSKINWNNNFRQGNIDVDDVPLELNAGLNLTRFETKIMKEDLNADLYVDKNNKISVQLKSEGKKIKTNLRLPAKEVTYLRYIMDSHFIPVTAKSKKDKKGFKINVKIA